MLFKERFSLKSFNKVLSVVDVVMKLDKMSKTTGYNICNILQRVCIWFVKVLVYNTCTINSHK